LNRYALEVIHEAKRPLLFVYIHGWQNNANSGDVCRFEYFIDTVSRYPEITGRGSSTAASRSESSGRATIKSRQAALTCRLLAEGLTNSELP
jgi:hypothetical protein